VVRHQVLVLAFGGSNPSALASINSSKIQTNSGNASKELKSKADLICDTVDNDGLANFIEDRLNQMQELKGSELGL
jgi:hypothetical protein